MKKRLFVTATVLGVLVLGGSAFAGTATFTCPESVDTTCYLVIIYKDSDNHRNFTLRSGEKGELGGLEPGDEYCMSTEGTPDVRECERKPVPLQ